jgi:NifU-like protein involved in Fe-S cluster formation
LFGFISAGSENPAANLQRGTVFSGLSSDDYQLIFKNQQDTNVACPLLQERQTRRAQNSYTPAVYIKETAMDATPNTTKVRPVVNPLENYTVEGMSECSACGRAVKMQLRIDNDIIVDAGGTVESCGYSRECMAALIATVIGMNVYDAQAVSSEDFQPLMTRVIEKLGCDNWCVAALRIALRNYRLRAAA